MPLIHTKCIQSVGGKLQCPTCFRVPIKHGFTKTGSQRYRCGSCKKSFLLWYKQSARIQDISAFVTALLKEGSGIRSIARLTGIGTNIVLRTIRKAAVKIKKPPVFFGQSYEMDELKTFIRTKGKKVWVAYAINRVTREVVDFRVGNRSNAVLGVVVNTLLGYHPLSIRTDGLINYKTLIPQVLHQKRPYGINYIERKNLTLRTHLKRLSRRTIAFSKSQSMLEACLKIYFWS